MAIVDQSIDLQLQILPESTQKAFLYLSEQQWLRDKTWYLAGGTALALQMGHRLSVDLDFFTPLEDFDTGLIGNLLSSQRWVTTLREKGTLYGEMYNTKMSFIAYPYFVPLHPFIPYGSIDLLHVQDIAVMKVIAISQRGRMRDFIDLYWYVQNREPLIEVLQRVDKQYPGLEHNYHHILKSLTYFEEAEDDPSPQLLIEISWDKVKSYFLDTVPQIANQLL